MITQETQIELLKQDIEYIKRAVDDIKQTLKKEYVEKAEFSAYKEKIDPVVRIVYGLVASILVGVLSTVGYVLSIVLAGQK